MRSRREHRARSTVPISLQGHGHAESPTSVSPLARLQDTVWYPGRVSRKGQASEAPGRPGWQGALLALQTSSEPTEAAAGIRTQQ